MADKKRIIPCTRMDEYFKHPKNCNCEWSKQDIKGIARTKKYSPKGWRVYVAGFVLISGCLVTTIMDETLNVWISLVLGIIIMTCSWLVYLAIIEEEVNNWFKETEINVEFKDEKQK